MLRIYGPRDGVVDAVSGAFVHFEESRASQRAKSTTATFCHTVSEAKGDRVPAQIEDAEAFLAAHGSAIASLMSHPGVEGGVLDFGWEVPSESAQWNRWPVSLLAACAEVGLALEVSVYPVDAGRPHT